MTSVYYYNLSPQNTFLPFHDGEVVPVETLIETAAREYPQLFQTNGLIENINTKKLEALEYKHGKLSTYWKQIFAHSSFAVQAWWRQIKKSNAGLNSCMRCQKDSSSSISALNG